MFGMLDKEKLVMTTWNITNVAGGPVEGIITRIVKINFFSIFKILSIFRII